MRHDKIITALDRTGAARVGRVVTRWEGTGVEVVVQSGCGVVDAGAEAGWRGGGGLGETRGAAVCCCGIVIKEAGDAGGAVVMMVVIGVEQRWTLDALGAHVFSIGCRGCGCGGLVEAAEVAECFSRGDAVTVYFGLPFGRVEI